MLMIVFKIPVLYNFYMDLMKEWCEIQIEINI